jgi:hypothetical protein
LRKSNNTRYVCVYPAYGNGIEIYQDKQLVNEIQTHFDTVFPEFKGRIAPPKVIANQFGRQVLIEPALSMQYQEEAAGELFERKGSILY